jgi:hypothetical protein
LGYPIGFGCVESANKLVVESRLKQAGMRWARQNIDPMLGLRNIACNDRWDEAWPQLVKHKLEASTQSRGQRRALKSLAQLQAIEIDSAQVPTYRVELQNVEDSAEDKPAKGRAKALYKPAADHPWRRKVFGRARRRTPEGFSRAKT